MDTIPSIQDLHQACAVPPRRQQSEDEAEDMEKIFEGPDEDPTPPAPGANLRDLTKSPHTDGRTVTAKTHGATVWTSGFEEEGGEGEASTPPTRLEGDPKYTAKPDEEPSMHQSASFPHIHHPIKLPHHHHHHHHRHHHRRRSRTTSTTSTTDLPPADGAVVDDAGVSFTAPGSEKSVSEADVSGVPHQVLEMSPEDLDEDSCVVDMAGGDSVATVTPESSITTKPAFGDARNQPLPAIKIEDPDGNRRVVVPEPQDTGHSGDTKMPSTRLPRIATEERRIASKERRISEDRRRVLRKRDPYEGDGGDEKEPSLSDEEHNEASPLMGMQPTTSGLKSCLHPGESEGILTSDDERRRSKVKFNIGSEFEEEIVPKETRVRRRRRRRTEEPPSWRRHPGSQHQLSSYHVGYDHPNPTTPEEASHLLEHDLDDITSHRFDDAAAYRRPRVHTRALCSVVHVSSRGSDKHQTFVRSEAMKQGGFDHQPHEVFVELSELKSCGSEAGLEWKETARWVKYEEDVEGVDKDRWGKPHVAFLNFHSLFSLRKGLDRGAVLLDLEEKDLPGIANHVVNHMVACDQIPAEHKEAVVNILLLRHRHVKENQFKMARRDSKPALDADGKTPASGVVGSASGGNLNNLRTSIRRAGISKVFQTHSIRPNRSFDQGIQRVRSSASFRDRFFSHDVNMHSGDEDGVQETYHNSELLKKIPEGAEATAVLVGAVDFLKQPTIAFVRLAEGVLMDNIVEVPIPVRFLFILLGPFHGEMDYHEVGRSISTLMSDKHFHEVAYQAHSRGQLLTAINEFLNASIVLPPAEWTNTDLIPVDQIREKSKEMVKRKETIRQKRLQTEPVTTPSVIAEEEAVVKRKKLRKRTPKRNPLKREGRLFHGVFQDLKDRMALYPSDIMDGLSPQVFAAAIFIFFASISPAITFGGMYGDKTDLLIGVSETLLVTSMNGVIFALFACQPLLIAGATGPLMIFDLSLYAFAKSNDLEFLPMRCWISFWMACFVIIIAAFEGVSIVKYLTKFTEEIFSTLVCLIFIYGAFEKLMEIFHNHPLKGEYCYEDINHTEIINGTIINGTLFNGTNAMGEAVDFASQPQPNTSLLSMILMIGTFIIAYKLKFFRNSKYLGRGVRRALGDFGVPISIMLMVLLDYLIHDTYTDKLTMPEGIQPSNPAIRGWFINPFGMNETLPVWVIFACGPASMLLFILIFIEENICQLILAKPERNMKKGSGFHWDIVLTCLINCISGMLGAPFMGPAVVRTVSHTSALTVMTTRVAPGESPKIEGVLEQRVSAFFVSVFVGLSIFLAPLLNMVPNAVLYGVFLYMGVSATAGIQFLERCILFFVPVKHYPNVPYVKQLKTMKMHIFTTIQILLVVVLWVVKQSPAALCFPFVLMILVPIRLYLLPYIFNDEELIALDGALTPHKENEELDFYEESHSLGNVIPPSRNH